MRVVVTGASSGIGAATVRALRTQGWDVVGVARREDRLAALAAETGASYVTADLTCPQQVAQLVTEVNASGPVHALVNNAGGAFGMHRVAQADVDVWRSMYELNVLATAAVTKGFLPAILASQRGSVVFVTSGAGHMPYEGGAGYAMSKHAERVLAQTLRMEHIKDNLRVIEIAPGLVKTEEFALNRLGSQEQADAVYAGVVAPLTAADVAQTVAWTLSLPQHVNVDSLVLRPVAQRFDNSVLRENLG